MRTEIFTFEGPLVVIDPRTDKAAVSIANNCLRNYGERLIQASQQKALNYGELGSLHYEIGKLHDGLTRHADAKTHYAAATQAFKQANEVSRQVAQAHLLLGEVRAHVSPVPSFVPGGPKSSAKSDFNHALTLGEQLGDLWLQARATYNLAQLKAFQGDYENALTGYQQAEKLISAIECQGDCRANALLLVEIKRSIQLVQAEEVISQANHWATELFPDESDVSTRSGGASRPWWARWRK